MSERYYEDAQTFEELLYNFSVDQYNEFAAVDTGDADIIGSKPLWGQISAGERQVLARADWRLEDALEQYADRWMKLQEEYNWARSYCEELMEVLPVDGVYGGKEPSLYRDWQNLNFRTYLDRHETLIQEADGPLDLENGLDDPTTRRMVDRNGEEWYKAVWDSLHIGDPPIRERIGDRPEDAQILGHAAKAMSVLDDVTASALDGILDADEGYGGFQGAS